jgi:hypothetical protein
MWKVRNAQASQYWLPGLRPKPGMLGKPSYSQKRYKLNSVLIQVLIFFGKYFEGLLSN